MIKTEIRKKYIEWRMLMSPLKAEEWSAAIYERFYSLDLPVPSYLMAYMPLMDKKEFDIGPCVEHVRNKYPGSTILWPRIKPSLEMEAVQPENPADFISNRYGILEPGSGQEIDPALIDCVFIPLLAYDRKGYRVGYGKGYYDRFLARCRPDILKIGFSYFEPEEVISDIDGFDIPLNICITPIRVYEF